MHQVTLDDNETDVYNLPEPYPGNYHLIENDNVLMKVLSLVRPPTSHC